MWPVTLTTRLTVRFLGGLKRGPDHRRRHQGAFTSGDRAGKQSCRPQAEYVWSRAPPLRTWTLCASGILTVVYDRGNPSQVIDPHQLVPPKTYTADRVKLPAPEDIPGVHMQVQNYHVPPVGTFHAKYMVADRKVALLNSNNIQDRVNVEMMVHVGELVPSGTR